MIVEGRGCKVAIPDAEIERYLRDRQIFRPQEDPETARLKIIQQLFPVYMIAAGNAKYEAQKRDKEEREAGRQAKIADLRQRLSEELRPAAMKEEALARRLQFQRNVETRLSLMIDRRLNEILQQEGIEF